MCTSIASKILKFQLKEDDKITYLHCDNWYLKMMASKIFAIYTILSFVVLTKMYAKLKYIAHYIMELI